MQDSPSETNNKHNTKQNKTKVRTEANNRAIVAGENRTKVGHNQLEKEVTRQPCKINELCLSLVLFVFILAIGLLLLFI
jgi:hypothetical protein